MGEWTRTTVRCFSGYKADERPLAFLYGNTQLLVRKITESWYEPEGLFFRVMANDGRIYLLKYDSQNDTWQVKQISTRWEQPFTLKSADDDDPSNGEFADLPR
jgi:hypothetical protein